MSIDLANPWPIHQAAADGNVVRLKEMIKYLFTYCNADPCYEASFTVREPTSKHTFKRKLALHAAAYCPPEHSQEVYRLLIAYCTDPALDNGTPERCYLWNNDEEQTPLDMALKTQNVDGVIAIVRAMEAVPLNCKRADELKAVLERLDARLQRFAKDLRTRLGRFHEKVITIRSLLISRMLRREAHFYKTWVRQEPTMHQREEISDFVDTNGHTILFRCLLDKDYLTALQLLSKRWSASPLSISNQGDSPLRYLTRTIDTLPSSPDQQLLDVLEALQTRLVEALTEGNGDEINFWSRRIQPEHTALWQSRVLRYFAALEPTLLPFTGEDTVTPSMSWDGRSLAMLDWGADGPSAALRMTALHARWLEQRIVRRADPTNSELWLGDFVGQRATVRRLCERVTAIRNTRVGLTRPDVPTVGLFFGSSGCGKKNMVERVFRGINGLPNLTTTTEVVATYDALDPDSVTACLEHVDALQRCGCRPVVMVVRLTELLQQDEITRQYALQCFAALVRLLQGINPIPTSTVCVADCTFLLTVSSETLTGAGHVQRQRVEEMLLSESPSATEYERLILAHKEQLKAHVEAQLVISGEPFMDTIHFHCPFYAMDRWTDIPCFVRTQLVQRHVLYCLNTGGMLEWTHRTEEHLAESLSDQDDDDVDGNAADGTLSVFAADLSHIQLFETIDAGVESTAQALEEEQGSSMEIQIDVFSTHSELTTTSTSSKMLKKWAQDRDTRAKIERHQAAKVQEGLALRLAYVEQLRARDPERFVVESTTEEEEEEEEEMEGEREMRGERETRSMTREFADPLAVERSVPQAEEEVEEEDLVQSEGEEVQPVEALGEEEEEEEGEDEEDEEEEARDSEQINVDPMASKDVEDVVEQRGQKRSYEEVSPSEKGDDEGESESSGADGHQRVPKARLSWIPEGFPSLSFLS